MQIHFQYVYVHCQLIKCFYFVYCINLKHSTNPLILLMLVFHVKHCSIVKKCETNIVPIMFKTAIPLIFYFIFQNVINGSIFTDPTKLNRLVEFQIRLIEILQTSDDVDLLDVPQNILVGLLR